MKTRAIDARNTTVAMIRTGLNILGIPGFSVADNNSNKKKGRAYKFQLPKELLRVGKVILAIVSNWVKKVGRGEERTPMRKPVPMREIIVPITKRTIPRIKTLAKRERGESKDSPANIASWPTNSTIEPNILSTNPTARLYEPSGMFNERRTKKGERKTRTIQ